MQAVQGTYAALYVYIYTNTVFDPIGKQMTPQQFTRDLIANKNNNWFVHIPNAQIYFCPLEKLSVYLYW